MIDLQFSSRELKSIQMNVEFICVNSKLFAFGPIGCFKSKSAYFPYGFVLRLTVSTHFLKLSDGFWKTQNHESNYSENQCQNLKNRKHRWNLELRHEEFHYSSLHSLWLWLSTICKCVEHQLTNIEMLFHVTIFQFIWYSALHQLPKTSE